MSIKIALFRVRFDDDDFDVVSPPDLERVYATGALVDGLVRWSSNPGNLSAQMLMELADKIERSKLPEPEAPPPYQPPTQTLRDRARLAVRVAWWKLKGLTPAGKRRRREAAMLRSYLGGIIKHPVQ
jgi:hypothetical protein